VNPMRLSLGLAAALALGGCDRTPPEPAAPTPIVTAELEERVAEAPTPPAPAHVDGALPPGHPTLPPGHPTLPPDHPTRLADRPAPMPAGGEVGGPVNLSDVVLNPPEGWVAERPRGTMRVAQYRLPRAEGDPRDGEVTVIRTGGSVYDNVVRWRSQFVENPEATVESREAVGREVSLVRIEGTYLHQERPMSPEPGVPQPGTVVRAVIIPSTGGQSVFIKAWGPEATMSRWEASFGELVEGLALP